MRLYLFTLLVFAVPAFGQGFTLNAGAHYADLPADPAPVGLSAIVFRAGYDVTPTLGFEAQAGIGITSETENLPVEGAPGIPLQGAPSIPLKVSYTTSYGLFFRAQWVLGSLSMFGRVGAVSISTESELGPLPEAFAGFPVQQPGRVTQSAAAAGLGVVYSMTERYGIRAELTRAEGGLDIAGIAFTVAL